jgi:glycosyltransferase involved in cell wall biosynthesis
MTNNKKLLYITNGITGVGGLERVLSIKASYLADHYNYEVHILSLNEQGLKPFYEFSSKIYFHTIPIPKNPIKYSWNYVCGLRKKVKQINPDIISVCDDGLKGFFVPKIIGKKNLIYERHASIEFNTNHSIKGKFLYFLMQTKVNDFKKMVVLTPSNINEWKGDGVIAIANPLSFYPKESSSLQNKSVIVVGSHSYNKGYDLLLSAWQKIAQKYPNWTLNIYGKLDTENTFVALATKMNVSDSVHFHSPVSDIEAAYRQSSIMVLSSRSEGFGMVLIEAMACGLPCVSFDCPSGPRDIIEDGKDGFLVPNGNIQKLADKILFLMENKDIRIEMGKTAKENAKRFLPEQIVSQWDNLFQELLN